MNRDRNVTGMSDVQYSSAAASNHLAPRRSVVQATDSTPQARSPKLVAVGRPQIPGQSAQHADIAIKLSNNNNIRNTLRTVGGDRARTASKKRARTARKPKSSNPPGWKISRCMSDRFCAYAILTLIAAICIPVIVATRYMVPSMVPSVHFSPRAKSSETNAIDSFAATMASMISARSVCLSAPTILPHLHHPYNNILTEDEGIHTLTTEKKEKQNRNQKEDGNEITWKMQKMSRCDILREWLGRGV